MDPSRPVQNPYEDFISTLPLAATGDASIFQLRKYQNFWISETFLPGVLAVQRNFRARPDDVYVQSFPKSGTTWLKALSFATLTRGRHAMADHPILTNSPHDCVPFIDQSLSMDQDFMATLEAMPSPRLLSSHIPFSMLPESIRESQCRIIYVCRDPKDVLVSRWHFDKRISAAVKTEPWPLSKALERYCEGVVSFGPAWEHILEYWNESLRRPDKVLFLRYEKIKQDPVGIVRRLAEFMGCPFSAAEEVGGAPEHIVRLCSFNNLKELKVNKTGALHNFLSYDCFFRRGEKGDWRNHLTDEMARRVDGVIRDKLKGRVDELFEDEA